MSKQPRDPPQTLLPATTFVGPSRLNLLKSRQYTDPFGSAKVETYSHKPNMVPPYVLDRLLEAHYKEQLNNTNVNTGQLDTAIALKSAHSRKDEDQYASFANDPFVKLLDSNWHNFLATIKQPTAYTSNLVKHDLEFGRLAPLDGVWGGDDRLKLALVGAHSSDDETYVDDSKSYLSRTLGLFCGFLSQSARGKPRDVEAPRVRSKAGYWMSDEKRADVMPTLKRIFVQNPLVPLFLRILIIIFSTAALALAGSIFIFLNRHYEGHAIEQQPSTTMAIVVQCCAVAYVTYIAYDEYSGKPLGLRNPLGKMKLIMLDLLFIIFSLANLLLTFNTLYDDEWVCQDDNTPLRQQAGIFYPTVGSICRRQQALASFLFLVLCLWVITFTISIVRVVDRVSVASPTRD